MAPTAGSADAAAADPRTVHLAEALTLTLRAVPALHPILLADGVLNGLLRGLVQGQDCLLPVAAQLLRGCTPVEVLPSVADLGALVRRLGTGDAQVAAHVLVHALVPVVAGQDSEERDLLVHALLDVGLADALLDLLGRDSTRAKSQCVALLRALAAYGAHADAVRQLLASSITWEAHKDQQHDLYHTATTGLLTYGGAGD